MLFVLWFFITYSNARRNGGLQIFPVFPKVRVARHRLRALVFDACVESFVLIEITFFRHRDAFSRITKCSFLHSAHQNEVDHHSRSDSDGRAASLFQHLADVALPSPSPASITFVSSGRPFSARFKENCRGAKVNDSEVPFPFIPILAVFLFYMAIVRYLCGRRGDSAGRDILPCVFPVVCVSFARAV